MQFKFLQKDMRQVDVETIEQMIEKNFSFYVFQDQDELYKDMEFLKR